MSDFTNMSALLVTRFNTDNPYSSFGQRILVWELVKEDGGECICAFLLFDIDRQLQYLIEWCPFDTRSPEFKNYIWTCYQLFTKIVHDPEFERFGQHVVHIMGGAHNYDFPSFRPHIVAFEYGEGRLRLSH